MLDKNTFILSTEQLILRNLLESDLDKLYDYINDERCAKYQQWEDTSREGIRKLIQNSKGLDKGKCHLGIAKIESNELIGHIFIAKIDKTITLGCTITPEKHSKGYAYEALSNLISYLSNTYSGYEIVACIHPHNIPSKKLFFKTWLYM